ncbi:MAG: MaoC/PaaZ C-terminal domain-containing protein [Oscillospiraceae bacterium]
MDLPGQMYFEDIKEGDIITTVGRTITESDIVNFAGITSDYNLIHTNAEYAKNSIAGQRIAHGLLVLAISSGLSTRTPYFTALNDAVTAFTAIKEYKFRRPVLIGDTIYMRMEVVQTIDAKPESDSGKVIFRRDVLNQRDEVVQEGVTEVLYKKRGR